MKCVCGYVEPTEWDEDIPVYYQSGKHKGELKHVETKTHYIDQKDKFIEILIERDFSFVVKDYSYYSESNQDVSLFACPKCKTVRME